MLANDAVGSPSHTRSRRILSGLGIFKVWFEAGTDESSPNHHREGEVERGGKDQKNDEAGREVVSQKDQRRGLGDAGDAPRHRAITRVLTLDFSSPIFPIGL